MEQHQSHSTHNSGPWTMWPVSPVHVFFVLAFQVLGGWFMWAALEDPMITRESLGLPFFIAGLIFVYSGILMAISIVKVDKWGLIAIGPVAKKRRRGYRGSFIPRFQFMGFGHMTRASLQMVRAGKGSACVLTISLKGDRSQTINMDPYTRQDCRKLIEYMRARGVNAFVQPGLLGRDFN